MAVAYISRKFYLRIVSIRLAGLALCLALTMLAGCAGPDARIAEPPPGQALPMVGARGAALRREELHLLSQALAGDIKDDLPLVDALRRSLDRTTLIAGNRVTLLTDGPSTFAGFAQAVADAHHHIHVETFIFADDKLGHSFAELLAEKSREGVQVRLMYDGFGSLGTDTAMFDRLRDAGVDVQAYQPLTLETMNTVIDGRFNQRDHRKLLVVDGRIAFVGGINISGTYNSGSSVHSGESQDLTDGWRDTQVRIEGPAVQQFQSLFFSMWAQAGGKAASPSPEYFPPLAPQGTALVAAVASEPGAPTEAAIHRTYLTAVKSARRRLWITQAYFAPDSTLRDALIAAAQRGVDVRILLPGFSDSQLVLNASRAIYGPLLRGGVHIFEFDAAFVHAKTAVVDAGVSLVGSANMDYRSLLDNNEVTALIVDSATNANLAARFRDDQSRATPVTFAQWNRRSLLQRAREGAATLLWRWL